MCASTLAPTLYLRIASRSSSQLHPYTGLYHFHGSACLHTILRALLRLLPVRGLHATQEGVEGMATGRSTRPLLDPVFEVLSSWCRGVREVRRLACQMGMGSCGHAPRYGAPPQRTVSTSEVFVLIHTIAGLGAVLDPPMAPRFCDVLRMRHSHKRLPRQKRHSRVLTRMRPQHRKRHLMPVATPAIPRNSCWALQRA